MTYSTKIEWNCTEIDRQIMMLLIVTAHEILSISARSMQMRQTKQETKKTNNIKLICTKLGTVTEQFCSMFAFPDLVNSFAMKVCKILGKQHH